MIVVDASAALAGLLNAGPARRTPGEQQVHAHVAVTRCPVVGLLARVWGLGDSLSAYDASYVALAEELGCALVTADARLSRAPGLRCPVTVVPG